MAEALWLPSLYGVGSARPTTSYHREIATRQWSRVKGLESPSWLRECYDRLNEIAHLQRNWDSYDAEPASRSAIEGARLLLSNLKLEDLPKPQILPVADGGVGFHWRVADRDLEIEIDSTGAYNFVKTMFREDGQPDSGVVGHIQEVQLLIDWLLERR